MTSTLALATIMSSAFVPTLAFPLAKPPPHLQGLDVAIVGGGVAGMATALALQTLAGVSSTVYEAESGIGKGDFGLSLWPNGMRALRCMDVDLHDEVVRAGSAVKETLFTTCEATHINYCDERAEYGHPLLCLRSSSLHNALRRSVLRHDCTISTGTLCKGVRPSPAPQGGSSSTTFSRGVGGGSSGVNVNGGRVELHLNLKGEEGEGEVVTAGLVIGADGLRSVVRKQLGDLDPPRDAEVVWFVGTVSHKACPLLMRSRLHQFLMQDPGNVAFLMPVGNYTYWAVALAGPDQYEAMTVENSGVAMRGYLEHKFGECKVLVEMVRATPSKRIRRHQIQDRPALESFVQGSRPGEAPIVLVGDAAHPGRPSLGQGANLALEDAVQLALLLRDADSVKEALREYDEARVDRCAMLQGDIDFVARRARTRFTKGVGAAGGTGDEGLGHSQQNRGLGDRDFTYNWEPVRLSRPRPFSNR
ncbi:unnamed protein product [Choristocarpus tenellus]